jgi:membrane peptidoglycan carboxypeptidase
VPVANPRCHRVLNPEVARGAIDAARCVTGYRAVTGNCGGGGTASAVYRTVGRPVAGKTGTTDDNRSAWFVGMTPALTIAGFIADPDNPFHLVTAAGHSKPRDSVAETLRDALAATPYRAFTPPSQQTAYGAGGKKGKSAGKATARRKNP